MAVVTPFGATKMSQEQDGTIIFYLALTLLFGLQYKFKNEKLKKMGPGKPV